MDDSDDSIKSEYDIMEPHVFQILMVFCIFYDVFQKSLSTLLHYRTSSLLLMQIMFRDAQELEFQYIYSSFLSYLSSHNLYRIMRPGAMFQQGTQNLIVSGVRKLFIRVTDFEYTHHS